MLSRTRMKEGNVKKKLLYVREEVVQVTKLDATRTYDRISHM